MNYNNYLAGNLRSYQTYRNITISQLAAELEIPLSTLRTILKDGNTTMDTVIRISSNLNVSLDELISSTNPEFRLPAKPACFDRNQIKNTDLWLSDFPASKRDGICNIITKVWDVIDAPPLDNNAAPATQNNYLAQNLKSYKSIQKISVRKLARQLGIPSSTLRNIMKDGNTTLDTAIRISENLSIGMEMLFRDANLSHKLVALYQIQRATRWLDNFSCEKHNALRALLSEVWAAMVDE